MTRNNTLLSRAAGAIQSLDAHREYIYVIRTTGGQQIRYNTIAMKNALIIKPNTITPPPTKTEILDAMVERAEQLYKQEVEKREKEKKDLSDKIDSQIKKLLSKGVAHLLSADPYWRSVYRLKSNGYFSLDLQIAPSDKEAKLKDDLLAYEAIDGQKMHFDRNQVRRDLQDKLNHKSPSVDRVQSLLANPEAVKAMDEIITQA